jgi:hypothetical protein
MHKSEKFLSLNIPSMSYNSGEESYYLVYSDSKNFIKVIASTAVEALEKSGVSKPYRIIHHMNGSRAILEDNELSLNKPFAEPSAPII